MGYMRKAFPRSFEDLVIEQTGPNSLYASFIEKGRTKPILASGVSDGHIQLLILPTALFSEGRHRFSLLLIDEPETSLHACAQVVLAEAIDEAADHWNKQILMATHSPALISQFKPGQILSVETTDGRSRITRLSEMPQIQDLLETYAAGSLFMSEAIAGQNGSGAVHDEFQEETQ
jgi:predicted ATPase